jgi:hypothetical protein
MFIDTLQLYGTIWHLFYAKRTNTGDIISYHILPIVPPSLGNTIIVRILHIVPESLNLANFLPNPPSGIFREILHVVHRILNTAANSVEPVFNPVGNLLDLANLYSLVSPNHTSNQAIAEKESA